MGEDRSVFSVVSLSILRLALGPATTCMENRLYARHRLARRGLMWFHEQEDSLCIQEAQRSASPGI